MDDKRYIKLFNYGYFLSEHEPEVLTALLSSVENQPEITDPLSAGRMEYQQENFREKIRDNRQALKTKEQDKGKDQDIEFDR